MIRSTGVFLSTAEFTAFYVAKFRTRLDQGLLPLRDEDGDLPILKEWKTARALLARFRAAAAPFLDGHTATLGKVWIEQLPGECGTPWTIAEDDYAQAHIRTRTCLIPSPGAWSLSGGEQLMIPVGSVATVEHRALCSEVNFSPYPRTHLIVDVKKPAEIEHDQG